MLKNAEARGICLKLRKGVRVALSEHFQRACKHEAEQFHKALAVYTVLAILQRDRKGVGGGHGNKVFNVLNAVETDHKMLVIFHGKLYKPSFIVYNNKYAQMRFANIISAIL